MCLCQYFCDTIQLTLDISLALLDQPFVRGQLSREAPAPRLPLLTTSKTDPTSKELDSRSSLRVVPAPVNHLASGPPAITSERLPGPDELYTE